MDSRQKTGDAGEPAQELDIPAEFETDHPRTRRKIRQFTYEPEDEPIENPETKLKMNMHFADLDKTGQ